MTAPCSIFISYRRSDEPGYVRALVSDLRHTFGGQHIFLDMETIEGGVDFAATIERALADSEVLLAVIGPEWMTAADETGELRLHDPEDFVALEIATALNLDVPVIPVLVKDAPIPERKRLPDRLQTLASLQVVVMSHDRWEEDIHNLVSAIDTHTVAPRLARQLKSGKQQLKEGHWEEALQEFEAIQSVKPDYPGIADLIDPLRDLAQRLAESRPSDRLWSRFALRHPLLTILTVTLIPHALAGVFNYVFNRRVIVLPMKSRGVEIAESVFETYSTVINSVLFPVGILILIGLIWPVAKGLREASAGETLSRERLADLRRRCLRLGHMVALVGISLWVVAGPVYPFLIGALEARDYLLFITSLAISGLAVAAYPFLIVTWLSTHLYYRPLLSPGLDSDQERFLLEQVGSMKWKYFLLTGAIPMMIISLGFILGPLHSSPQLINPLLGVVGLLGMGGFLMALALFKALQSDFALLRKLVWACGRK